MERKILIFGAVGLLVAFILGIVIGYASSGGSANDEQVIQASKLMSAHKRDMEALTDKMVSSVNPDQIREYLQFLSKEPHIAGLRRDRELTNWIKNTWEDAGLDHVNLEEYDYMLSWPNQSNPNKIRIIDDNGNTRFTSQHKEKELRKGDDHPDFVHAFNAFSPAGTVEGDLVFVNYGRIEDFQQLEDLGYEEIIKGKICIARYGKIFRGNKVKNCQNYGGIGMILFSDPADVAILGTEPENVYPNTVFLPGSGVQRGSVFIGDGEPLSPGWPSVPNAYREKPENIDGLPKIPVQPIGYDDAQVILEKMGGKPSPKNWRGKIEGVKYNLGGEMLPEFKGWKVKVSVHNTAKTIKSSHIVGTITGAIEPDRYVYLSNHRDAWGYGSVDPSSGTAQLMENVRLLGKLHKDGWRPRRTIVFVSWAAEEHGVFGSYEWVDHKMKKITARSVGLVNTDICVAGPIVKPQASPILKDILIDSLKSADDPRDDENENKARAYFPSGKTSYYDYWYDWYNQDSSKVIEPKVSLLGSGSDHAAFAFQAGVPSVNLRFKDDTKKYKGLGQYATYHTGYETFYLMDKIIDPGFKLHKICSQSALKMILTLSESLVLPYNLKYYPKAMKDAMKAFRNKNVTSYLEDNGATTQYLEAAIDEFNDATIKFMNKLDDINLSNSLELRQINDQLMMLERVFIMPRGLPGRPTVNHAIFAPAKFNAYGAAAFPGISDLLHEIEKLRGEESLKRWEEVKRHISDLMIMVQDAANFLKPVELI